MVMPDWEIWKQEIKNNWKLMFHLFFRTYHFGVNNQWWCSWKSMFGLSWWKIEKYRFIRNFKLIIFRASIGFIPKMKFEKMFPNSTKK